MGAQRTTFDKLQRERAKKAKAAAKRERRQERAADGAGDAGPLGATDGGAVLSAAELLERIEEVHRRFEAKTITFEEFEETKADLFARLALLPID